MYQDYETSVFQASCELVQAIRVADLTDFTEFLINFADDYFTTSAAKAEYEEINNCVVSKSVLRQANSIARKYRSQQ